MNKKSFVALLVTTRDCYSISVDKTLLTLLTVVSRKQIHSNNKTKSEISNQFWKRKQNENALK